VCVCVCNLRVSLGEALKIEKLKIIGSNKC